MMKIWKVRNKLEEIWKDIPGYETLYQVSNLGRVKRLKFAHVSASGITTWIKKEKIIKPKVDKKGYLFVRLGNGTKTSKNMRIARLVASVFISKEPFARAQVDHIDRNRQNNRVENLRWVSNSQNCRNKSNNTLFEIDGVTKTMIEWCEVYNIPFSRFQRRLYYGWGVKEALISPLRKRVSGREVN